jgi:putative ABC transport system substrate-binding protein
MRRRALVLVLGGVAAAWPFALWAQPQRGVWRIGYLAASPRPTDDVFRHALRELGYIEGHNLTILCRWGESGNYEAMAQDLVRLNVDLIVAVGSPAAQAAKNATRRIPIVFYLVGDPVGYGIIPSLAHPGSNITGMSTQLSAFAPKGLQFIKEIVPMAAKLAILGDPSNPGTNATIKAVEAGALTLGLTTAFYGDAISDELTRTFTAILRERPDALFVIPNLFPRTQRLRIIEFALTNRIPALYGLKEYVTDGGLISLGPNRDDIARRAAGVLDKILKGAQPADIPVEQPTTFELVINLTTAKTLGLTIPQWILVRADEVIE